MSKNAFWYSVPPCIIAVAIAAAFVLHMHERHVPAREVPPAPAAHPALPEQAKAPAHLAVQLSLQGLYTHKPISITEGETMLALLQQQNAADPQMQLATQEYSGLGVLITSMGGQTNGVGKRYWQYRVNGVEPQIGASGYILKNADTVEWFFSPSQR